MILLPLKTLEIFQTPCYIVYKKSSLDFTKVHGLMIMPQGFVVLFCLLKIDKRNLNPLKQMRVIDLSASVAKVPSATALQVLRKLGSIFTSVYAAVQELKKDSWLELQFSLADNSMLNVVYLLNRRS
ncbi:hypothetical protein Tco_1070505 [Tanacetum coccineum]|uniref:Uncharacterized protein n=1 Tax=Tanacetum coccineum TaxID=301880 RepID=A0ABQ5HLM0_9ASTR